MKASELRIGNIIGFETGYHIVVAGDIVDCDNGMWHDKDVYGMALTKEWFVRFGYKPRNTTFITGTAIDCFPDKQGLWFSKRDKDNDWTVMDHEHAISSIEFVHELQNIVAIIDRKELKLY